MPTKKLEDPSPAAFRFDILISAIVIVVTGILVLIFASVVAGAIITLIGAIFGIGGQVVRNIHSE